MTKEQADLLSLRSWAFSHQSAERGHYNIHVERLLGRVDASLNGEIESKKCEMNLKQLLWTYYSGLNYNQSEAELTAAKLHQPAHVRTAQLISF